jgi:hypothetical protein
MEDPGALLLLQELQGFPGKMAAETDIRFHVDYLPDFGRVRRIDDFPRLIEYADAVNALLTADTSDAILYPGSIIVQHVVSHVRFEVFAELVRMPLNLKEQALVFGLDIEVSENADHYKDRQHHAEG